MIEDILTAKPQDPIDSQVHAAVTCILAHYSHLTNADTLRLSSILPADQSKALDIYTEITEQHKIVSAIKTKILGESHSKFNDVSAKDLSILVTSFNSFLSLFIRSRDVIREEKELVSIENGLCAAIAELPDDYKQPFIDRLEHLINLKDDAPAPAPPEVIDETDPPPAILNDSPWGDIEMLDDQEDAIL